MKQLALLILVMSGCTADFAEVRIVGNGEVVAGNVSCRDSCKVRIGTELSARANDGAMFTGWSGACSGVEDCVALGDVVATFVSKPRLIVRVEGNGVVKSSSGKTCTTDCEWVEDTPVSLSAIADANAFFLGFSGSCQGTLACDLQSGEVIARFGARQQLHVNITGIGTVSVGDQSCTESCTLQLAPGPQSVAVSAAASFMFSSISGACTALPCNVSPPATLNVVFEPARRLTVTLIGNGQGTVFLDDESFCTNSTCSVMLSTTRAFELHASTASDYMSFRGLSGPGCSAVACSIPAGTEDIAINASFIRTLLWHRTFDARGDTLFADEKGLIVSMVAQRTVTIDGTTYDVDPMAAPEFGVIAEFNWDGGTNWVVALNHHDRSHLTPLLWFHGLLRNPYTEEVLASGWCRTGQVDGQIQCNSNETPLLLGINDGGLDWAIADRRFGTDNGNRAVIRDLMAYDGGIIGFRGVGAFFGETTGALGRVDRQLDGGFTPVFGQPKLYSQFELFPNRLDCTPIGEGLRCSFVSLQSFSVDGCVVPPLSGATPMLLMDFSPQLQCLRARRITGENRYITSPSAPNSAGKNYIAGLTNGIANITDTISVGPSVSWLAEWGPTDIERVSSFSASYPPPATLASESQIQVDLHDDSIIILSALLGDRGDVHYWGRTVPAPCILLAFIASDDLSTPTRHLGFCSNDSNRHYMTTSRFFVIGDKLVIFVTGTTLRFGDTPLFTSPGVQSHLVVLQL